MLTYLRGDLLSSPAQVLVNTVNTVGVMGKGIAFQFKNKYPNMFIAYREACEKHLLDVGKLYLWKSPKKWVLMFPTKKHWRNPSKLEYIESGLEKLVKNYERLGIESIAFPKLGCGNGNLKWSEVKPLMEKYLKPLPIRIYIYIDNYIINTPEHEDVGFANWLHHNPKDMSFNEIKEELQSIIQNNSQLLLNDGRIKNIEWIGDAVTITNGHQISIKDEEFCDFWDYMRNVGIIELDSIPEIYSEYSEILLALLSKLKYLQPILAANDEKKINTGYAYQFAEG